MGNWNRRYLSRKKGRYDQYEEPPPCSSRSYDTQSNSLGIEDNRVPSWEVDYCNSLKIPWYKILASKKYIYCYPTVLNWDDSAGEEAFHDAKQRFWKMINGLPCDNPLPDPNMFIDEIDWNPYLDPELMTDIETLYFNLDKSHMVDELETINEEEHAQIPTDTNHCTNNPWEKDHSHDSPSFKDTLRGWRQYHDPWEQSLDKIAESLKENGWRSGNRSSGWGPGPDNAKSFSRGVAGQQEGWGHSENKSWTRGRGNSNDQEFRNLGNCGYSRSNNWSTGFRERCWRDNGNGPWISRDEPNCWDHDGFRKGDGCFSFHGGGRKRESSFQSIPKYKSSRYRRL